MIAVDWQGMGCSSREVAPLPSVSLLANLCSAKREEQLSVSRLVTNQLIDNLRELLEAENITKFTLAGHSLGIYRLFSALAIAYGR